jgi:hypothetical protein
MYEIVLQTATICRLHDSYPARPQIGHLNAGLVERITQSLDGHHAEKCALTGHECNSISSSAST